MKQRSADKVGRREFLKVSAAGTLGVLSAFSRAAEAGQQSMGQAGSVTDDRQTASSAVKLFLCGDVMTGRGIDQALPHPGDPRLFEPYITTAVRYLELAEEANGPIPKPVDFSYIWGDALDQFDCMAPDVKIANLETAVTRSNEYWPGKGINYRMNPGNIACITAAGIDCCALANNHVLDWGYNGLAETLRSLREARVNTAGAGSNLDEASAPAVINIPGKGRAVIFSLASETSGVPWSWAAAPGKPGVYLIRDFSARTVREFAAKVSAVKRQGDVVIASIHWGGNWGYEIPGPHRTFAHRLIDRAGVDLVHGHSSHHPRGMEVYRNKLILYGCGDFLNDYEGISGYEAFRGDLTLMYFARLEPASGRLLDLEMRPMQIRNFRLKRASSQDAGWLAKVLDRESSKLGARVEARDDHSLVLRW
ncbi:CapA family protein [Thiogranum longum]